MLILVGSPYLIMTYFSDKCALARLRILIFASRKPLTSKVAPLIPRVCVNGKRVVLTLHKHMFNCQKKAIYINYI